MSDRAELETSQASSLRGLIASAAMLLVACSGGGSSNTPDLDPNIVMILADDHGYPYFGFMGSEDDDEAEAQNEDTEPEEEETAS